MLNRNPVVPRDRPLVAVGYKYNTQKIIYFIFIEYSGSTNAGIQYLSNYPGPFSNFAIITLACPLSCLSYFDMLMRLTLIENQGSLI